MSVDDWKQYISLVPNEKILFKEHNLNVYHGARAIEYGLQCRLSQN